MKKNLPCKGKHKAAAMAITVSEQQQQKRLCNKKIQGYFLIMKKSIHQDTTIISTYMHLTES